MSEVLSTVTTLTLSMWNVVLCSVSIIHPAAPAGAVMQHALLISPDAHFCQK